MSKIKWLNPICAVFLVLLIKKDVNCNIIQDFRGRSDEERNEFNNVEEQDNPLHSGLKGMFLTEVEETPVYSLSDINEYQVESSDRSELDNHEFGNDYSYIKNEEIPHFDDGRLQEVLNTLSMMEEPVQFEKYNGEVDLFIDKVPFSIPSEDIPKMSQAYLSTNEQDDYNQHTAWQALGMPHNEIFIEKAPEYLSESKQNPKIVQDVAMIEPDDRDSRTVLIDDNYDITFENSPTYSNANEDTKLTNGDGEVTYNESEERKPRTPWRAVAMPQNVPKENIISAAKYVIENIKTKKNKRETSYQAAFSETELHSRKPILWKQHRNKFLEPERETYQAAFSETKLQSRKPFTRKKRRNNFLERERSTFWPQSMILTYGKRSPTISDFNENSRKILIVDPHIIPMYVGRTRRSRVIREVKFKVQSCWKVVGNDVYFCKHCPDVCTKDTPTYLLDNRDSIF